MIPPRDGATVTTHVQTLAPSATAALHVDTLAVEAPLEVRIAGQDSTILMRTPGHDEELLRGFLFNEGFITALADIVQITRPVPPEDAEHGNVIGVTLRTSSKVSLDRSLMSSASCGACGKRTLAAIRVQAPVNTSPTRIDRATLARLPETLRGAQALFAQTGGVHASGLFTSTGDLLAMREDVGRHNALDKLIGWALAAGLVPLTEYVLLLSGRVSFELVQKAIVAGLPIIAAVGAPSSLAVELAHAHGITLIGFLRGDTMNVYTHASRMRNALENAECGMRNAE